MSALEIFWTAIVSVLWLLVAGGLLKAARTGDFGYWRRKAGHDRTPALRSAEPVRFWLRWIALAVPFLGLPLLLVTGLLLGGAQQ